LSADQFSELASHLQTVLDGVGETYCIARAARTLIDLPGRVVDSSDVSKVVLLGNFILLDLSGRGVLIFP
jgi:hypothetical protein